MLSGIGFMLSFPEKYRFVRFCLSTRCHDADAAGNNRYTTPSISKFLSASERILLIARFCCATLKVCLSLQQRVIDHRWINGHIFITKQKGRWIILTTTSLQLATATTSQYLVKPEIITMERTYIMVCRCLDLLLVIVVFLFLTSFTIISDQTRWCPAR